MAQYELLLAQVQAERLVVAMCESAATEEHFAMLLLIASPI